MYSIIMSRTQAKQVFSEVNTRLNNKKANPEQLYLLIRTSLLKNRIDASKKNIHYILGFFRNMGYYD